MDKKIVITNGCNESGKDTFFMFCSEHAKVQKISSITPFKYIASMLGHDGEKNEKYRTFLSEIKKISIEYNNFPFEYIMKHISNFYNSEDEILMIDIREPKEIEKIKKHVDCITVLVKNKNSRVAQNSSDINVYNFDYDFVVENNGTLEKLREKAHIFIEKIKEI